MHKLKYITSRLFFARTYFLNFEIIKSSAPMKLAHTSFKTYLEKL